MTGKDGKSVTLTEEEIEMIRRITAGQFPEAGYDPYEVTPAHSLPSGRRTRTTRSLFPTTFLFFFFLSRTGPSFTRATRW